MCVCVCVCLCVCVCVLHHVYANINANYVYTRDYTLVYREHILWRTHSIENTFYMTREYILVEHRHDCMYMYVYVCICMYMYVYVCIHTPAVCMNTYIYIQSCLCMHIHIDIYACLVCVCVCVCVCVDMHIHITWNTAREMTRHVTYEAHVILVQNLKSQSPSTRVKALVQNLKRQSPSTIAGYPHQRSRDIHRLSFYYLLSLTNFLVLVCSLSTPRTVELLAPYDACATFIFIFFSNICFH